MTEEERRRYENSHNGDALDDKIEDFFNILKDSYIQKKLEEVDFCMNDSIDKN